VSADSRQVAMREAEVAVMEAVQAVLMSGESVLCEVRVWQRRDREIKEKMVKVQ